MSLEVRRERARTNSPAVHRRISTAAFFLAAVVAGLAIGGCLPVPDDKPDAEKPNNDEPNEPACTAQFVNTSPYDATVIYYVGTEDQRFESLLLRDGTRMREVVVPAGEKHVTDAIPCVEVESIILAQVRFDLGAGLSARGATELFLQGEDYRCEDTLRFVMDYRIKTEELTLEFVVPPDCNENRVPDDEEIADGTAPDCDANGVPDECDLAAGDAADENGDGVPDDCEPE